MTKKQAEKRIKELREITAYHAKRYYDDDDPEISDFEYDMLMLELRNLENKYPDLIDSSSLTQHVGGTVKEGFEKVTHEVPLQSLLDIFNFDDLKDFDDRVRKVAEEKNIPLKYVVETKIDGLSVSLEYKNGIFVRGATRGNGLVGEDITENLKTIPHIPKKLKEDVDIIVRGEVFISKAGFDKMNEEREILEQPLFANARNAAAGSLRQLDSRETAKRPLDIYIFNVQKSDTIKFTSHYESLLYMEKLGFNVNPVKIFCDNLDEAISAINKISFTVPDWVPGLGGKQFGGFNLQKIQPVNIPYLANGGITTGATIAKIGEAGREAVLPLENNTGWMDDLASKLASKMPDYSGAKTVVLAVDGKEFARINLPYLQDEEIRLGIAEG